MDLTDWYAVAFGCLIAFILAIRSSSSVLKLKYACDRYFCRIIRGAKKRTWLGGLLFLLFLIGNILGLALYVEDIKKFVKRSGLMSIINLVPLSLGGRMNIMANYSGIDLTTFAGLHRWLGRIVIVESLIHATVGISSQRLDLHGATDVAAIVAAATLATILLSGVLRRYSYEAFLWLHMLLAVAVIASVYIHLPIRELSKPPAVHLLSAVCLLVLSGTFQFLHILYRNVRPGKPLGIASVRLITYKRQYKEDIPVPDAVHLHVRLPAPWELRPGQYVYLCIPGVSRTSFIQLHPFYIAWGYCDNDGENYAVLIVQKEKGFTQNLFSHVGNDFGDSSQMRAVIEGPYGKELNLGHFGTVLLFTTGVGIAAQLPYVSQLLAEYQDNETRRIALFWEVEAEVQIAWVAERMQMLLSQDTNKILDICLFVAGGFLSPTTRRGDHVLLGERMDMTYDAMDSGELINSEIRGRKGRVVVSLCVDNETSNKIHKVIRQKFERKVHIKELEFRPKKEKLHASLSATAAKLGQRAFGIV